MLFRQNYTVMSVDREIKTKTSKSYNPKQESSSSYSDASVSIVRVATLAQLHSRSVVVGRVLVMQSNCAGVEREDGRNASDDSTSTGYTNWRENESEMCISK